MNTYSKFVPNVWLAKCTEEHEKGDTIQVSTRYGKENDSIVHNLIKKDEEFFYYSIVRADGFNAQEHAKKKAEKLNGYASNAEKKSNEYYEKSNKDRKFLSLGEPIKIGHHSEGRHRKAIDQVHNNMSKCVEANEKAKKYTNRAEYWEKRKDKINLSMPESLDYYTFKLEKAKEKHQGLKDGTIKKAHSFSLAYAKKEVNLFKKQIKLAQRLWA